MELVAFAFNALKIGSGLQLAETTDPDEVESLSQILL